MRVFIGGLASRHSLSVDQLDDIELAVETLFREEPASGADLTLTISVEGGTFKVTLGGLCSPLIRRALGTTGRAEAAADGRMDILRMVMDALVDSYQAKDGAAGEAAAGVADVAAGGAADSFLVEMEKRIH